MFIPTDNIQRENLLYTVILIPLKTQDEFLYDCYFILDTNRAGQYLNTLYLNTVFKYIYCIYTLYLNTFFNLYLITVFNYF